MSRNSRPPGDNSQSPRDSVPRATSATATASPMARTLAARLKEETEYAYSELTGCELEDAILNGTLSNKEAFEALKECANEIYGSLDFRAKPAVARQIHNTFEDALDSVLAGKVNNVAALLKKTLTDVGAIYRQHEEALKARVAEQKPEGKKKPSRPPAGAKKRKKRSSSVIPVPVSDDDDDDNDNDEVIPEPEPELAKQKAAGKTRDGRPPTGSQKKSASVAPAPQDDDREIPDSESEDEVLEPEPPRRQTRSTRQTRQTRQTNPPRRGRSGSGLYDKFQEIEKAVPHRIVVLKLHPCLLRDIARLPWHSAPASNSSQWCYSDRANKATQKFASKFTFDDTLTVTPVIPEPASVNVPTAKPCCAAPPTATTCNMRDLPVRSVFEEDNLPETSGERLQGDFGPGHTAEEASDTVADAEEELPTPSFSHNPSQAERTNSIRETILARMRAYDEFEAQQQLESANSTPSNGVVIKKEQTSSEEDETMKLTEGNEKQTDREDAMDLCSEEAEKPSDSDLNAMVLCSEDDKTPTKSALTLYKPHPLTPYIPPLPHPRKFAHMAHFLTGISTALTNILEDSASSPTTSLPEIIDNLIDEKPTLMPVGVYDWRITVLDGCVWVYEVVERMCGVGLKELAGNFEGEFRGCWGEGDDDFERDRGREEIVVMVEWVAEFVKGESGRMVEGARGMLELSG